MENNEFNFFEEKPASNVSLSEINSMVKELFSLKAKIEDLEAAADVVKAEKETLSQKILQVLEAQNMTKLPTEHGLVYKQTKMQVSMPKDPGRAAQLRAFFAKNGMEDLLTVNHMTLNSVYNSIIDEMEAQGKTPDLDNLIPGVEKPTARDVLAMKKGK